MTNVIPFPAPCRILMWSGSSYDEAIQQARDLGSEFGPTLDFVVVA